MHHAKFENWKTVFRKFWNIGQAIFQNFGNWKIRRFSNEWSDCVKFDKIRHGRDWVTDLGLATSHANTSLRPSTLPYQNLKVTSKYKIECKLIINDLVLIFFKCPKIKALGALSSAGKVMFSLPQELVESLLLIFCCM